MSIVLGWGLPFSVNTDVSRSFYGSLVVLSPGDMRTNQTLPVPVFMEHEFCCENVYDQVIEQRTEKSLNVIFNVNHHGSWLIAPQTQRRKQIKNWGSEHAKWGAKKVLYETFEKRQDELGEESHGQKEQHVQKLW